MNKYSNVVEVKGVYYNLEDCCTECGHAFPCNENGSTKMSGYVQISTQFIRFCPNCDAKQPWKLKKGKQPFNHKINSDLLEEQMLMTSFEFMLIYLIPAIALYIGGLWLIKVNNGVGIPIKQLVSF